VKDAAIAFLIGFAAGWAPSAIRAWLFHRMLRQAGKAFARMMARPAAPSTAPADVRQAAIDLGKERHADAAPLCLAWPTARADDRCGCGHVLTMHAGRSDRGYGFECCDKVFDGSRCRCGGFVPPPIAEPGRSPPEDAPLNPAWVAAGKPRD